ncbi:aldehyde dehydrogenase [Sphingobium nicotianae]|uniref:Aldehyde dehydrogenase n=1 Tax=Sphingobium nicotianae TaxID=2782607 RepID=A0A9X1IRI7_9SPHN|nr:aldehyde dehydrogenase [Sphingobium nicotianae]MBT2187364.1 aldehyde dehydrogenase [Sphingobium nicotianae]
MSAPNLRHPDKLFIGGEWVEAHSGRQLEITSPDTEQVVFRVAEADETDVDRAVAAARKAFDQGPWPWMAPAERVAAMKRFVEALKRREGELGSAWSMQMGGMSFLAPYLTGRGTQNLQDAIDLGGTFPFISKVASDASPTAYVVHEPVGVVAAIAPWNVPYMIMCAKLGPALLSGSTVIMKPSPETPVEAYILAECAEEADLPPGVINLVPANREASDHLVNNPGVDKVSFTGSTLAGKRIGEVCASRVARCTLELGGKSAAIIMDDMPAEEAGKILSGAITLLSGQVCAMLTRAIVPRHRHDEIADAIASEMQKIRLGHSDDTNAQMGPLAMQRQLERVESYIEKGKKEGADLVTGGNRPASMNRGYFFEPTLFANVNNNSAIAQEEIFGPVLSLIPADDIDDAIRIANESNYGLNGSVLTHDINEAWRVARRVRTGNVGQNGMRSDFSLPFGGYKQSGIGREGGAQGLHAYLETKTILLDAEPAELV